MDIIEACRIIISRSPNAAEEAIRTISAARNNSPVLQTRYLNTLQRALADPQAEFTREERETLSMSIGDVKIEGRDYMLRIRLTDSEHDALESAASAAGITMSDYARDKIFS